MKPSVPRPKVVSDLLIVLGAVLVAVAVGMVNVAAGVGTAGVALVLVGMFLVDVDAGGDGR